MSFAAGGGGAVANPDRSAEVRGILKNGHAFYAITHGKYYRSLPTAVVPSDTLLFIAQEAGDICLIDLDKPLWFLMQPRTRNILFSVMTGNPFTSDDKKLLAAWNEENHENLQRETIADALMQFGVYVPGDKYVDRVLQIGDFSAPGSVEEQMGFYSFGSPVESEKLFNRRVYAHYTVGKDETVRKDAPVILHGLRKDLAATAKKYTLVSKFISKLPPEASPRIVFITSCGAVLSAANVGPALEAEGGLGHINKMTYFPELTHAASHHTFATLHAVSGDPPNVLPEDVYPKSVYRESQIFHKQQKGSGRRRTQKVKRGRRRHTRQQRRRQ